MFADPDISLNTTKVECSLSDDEELCAPNELFLPNSYVEGVVSRPAAALVTLEEDDDVQIVGFVTDNPFCDPKMFEDIPEDFLPINTVKRAISEILLLSDDEDAPRPSDSVEIVDSKLIDIKPLVLEKEPVSDNNSHSNDRHKAALQKFANFLAEHNIQDIRASAAVQIPVHADLLQPNVYSGVAKVLGSNLASSPRCSDDIVVRDNTIEVDLGERFSLRAMRKLKKRARKMNSRGSMSSEQKKMKKARKKEKELARLNAQTTTVAEKHSEKIRLDHHSTPRVDMVPPTPIGKFDDGVIILDDDEPDVDETSNISQLFGNFAATKVVSTEDSKVAEISGILKIEESGVATTGGEEGMDVEEFSFIANGDFEAHSSKLKTSTPYKPVTAQPEESIEDFFGDDYFCDEAVHTDTLGSSLGKSDSGATFKGDSGIHGTLLTTSSDKNTASKQAFSEERDAPVDVCPITNDLRQMMEEFDNNSGDCFVEIIDEEEQVQKTPGLAIEGSATGADAMEGIEEILVKIGNSLDAERKGAEESKENKECDGAPADRWNPNDYNCTNDTIVLDSFVQESQQEPAKKKAKISNDEISVIVIDGHEDVKWRMLEVERGPSSTQTGLFCRYKLPPHDGEKRECTIFRNDELPPNIPLEQARVPSASAVPPPVAVADFGPTMFGVPLDHSVLKKGIQMEPFIFKSTTATTVKKRLLEETPRRPQLSEQLGVTSDSWKPKAYAPPPVKWTVEDQLAINRVPHITREEKELQDKGVIKEYGILPRDQYQFPFDPYEGLYWPVFQPFDDVDLRNKDDTDAADVKNQLTDLSVCNYISKKDLLCDAAPNKWKQSFLAANRMTPAQREKNGRFANRVAYARKINQQSRDEMRASDLRKQREQEERRMEQEKEIAEAEAQGGEDQGGERLKATEARIFSVRMADHVRENILDEYSSKHFCCGYRKKSVFPAHWVKVPRWQYIPANDRRTYLCLLVKHFNLSTVNIMEQIQEARRGDIRPRDYLRYLVMDVVQANYAQQSSANYQLRLQDIDRIQSKKRNKALESKFPVGSTVRTEDLRKAVKMQDWELKYWTFIWDCYASTYKTMPPVSLIVKDIHKAVDNAFKELARPDHRDEYHEIYLRHKNEYLKGLQSSSRR